MTELASPQGVEAQAMPDAIDAIIDSAETNTPKPVEDSEVKQDETPEETFPKKAVNALSRRDKQIGKLKAQYEQAQSELNQLRQAQAVKPQVKSDGAPKEADFNNYADYMEARTEWKIEQRLADRDGKQQQAQTATQEEAYINSRREHLSATAKEFVKSIPDAQSVIDDHADIADEFPPHIQRLFLDADNAPLAFYNLAKEGKLEALASMSPARAAMEIGRAQAQTVTKPQTKAPAPLPASRGSVASGKSLDSMSGDELLKWINTKD